MFVVPLYCLGTKIKFKTISNTYSSLYYPNNIRDPIYLILNLNLYAYKFKKLLLTLVVIIL